MPLYDYLGGTADKVSDELYETVRQGQHIQTHCNKIIDNNLMTYTLSLSHYWICEWLEFRLIVNLFHGHQETQDFGLNWDFAGRNEKPDFVFLAHGTELLSAFHLPFGIPSFAAWPYATRWFLWPLWPLTLPILAILWIFGRPFAADKYRLKDLRTETWVVPRFGFQVSFFPFYVMLFLRHVWYLVSAC